MQFSLVNIVKKKQFVLLTFLHLQVYRWVHLSQEFEIILYEI